MIPSSNPDIEDIEGEKQRDPIRRLQEYLKRSQAWAVAEPYYRRVREFFGRPLVQHYLQLAERRATWAVLLFLVWRLAPIAYESAIFPFDLDLFATQAATTLASEDHIRRGIVSEAEDRGLRVSPDDVRVQVDSARRTVVLDVTYHGPVDLFVKEFTLDFHTHTRRYAVALPMDMR